MKRNWRREERSYYLPGPAPWSIQVPMFKFFTISGSGDPNSEPFSQCVEALYAASYGVRMSAKQGLAPEGFVEYTVYPLEGVWDLREEARPHYDGTLDKDALIYTLMIRQPDFLTESAAKTILDHVQRKKRLPLLASVQYQEIEEGLCLQMLHEGSYDAEPESFSLMEAWAHEHTLKRVGHHHREIYLTDARKVSPENYRTVLRFPVEPT